MVKKRLKSPKKKTSKDESSDDEISNKTEEIICSSVSEDETDEIITDKSGIESDEMPDDHEKTINASSDLPTQPEISQTSPKRKTTPKKPASKTKPSTTRTAKPNISDTQLKSRILAFLRQNMRPFTLQDLMISFKNEVPKKQLQTVLSELCAADKIFYKEYGKSLFYLTKISQENLGEEDIAKLNSDFDREKAMNQELKDTLKKCESRLKKILEIPNDIVLTKEISRIEAFLKDGNLKLKAMCSNEGLVTTEQMKSVDLEIKKMKTILKTRKESFKNAIHTLKEGLGKNEEEVYEEIGL